MPDSQQGKVPFREYETWYRMIGHPEHSHLTPLVVVHGGPGCTHDYIDAFRDLAANGRPVIHYDQLGNGQSTHLPEKGEEFWTVELFLEELDNLLNYLGIQHRYMLLGQSWGGILSAEHAVRTPAGLKGLVIANSPASMELWLKAAFELRSELPQDVQKTLLAHEQAGTIDSPEYKAASDVFYQRHVCRLQPWPDEVKRTFAAIDDDPTVYHTMNGPTEFHVIGPMKDWSIIDRLNRINVPTLVISGYYDEAKPECVQPYADRIAGAEWEIFPNSSHMPHVEERTDCMARIERFFEEKGL
ncbi:proline iminopeptidase-family hydrolase [Gynuella sunshinyii]|uniref:Putative hydrolase or acyltransferase (Alpha/beta hydrolase superfamily) n=1 Tax=Gynuella sunshinyii YC6258 TaxID=1445510 RepID=A0A0C5VPB1_9GAMM|nr:proline iminopeptidase-family hydrolase [Gynuella sunshinyii]AJQ96492.1 putative hydrolase or acyltransferase (alpha/beta hydrolase superfamily) [Gynuella sunshinyii YC6258]